MNTFRFGRISHVEAQKGKGVRSKGGLSSFRSRRVGAHFSAVAGFHLPVSSGKHAAIAENVLPTSRSAPMFSHHLPKASHRC